MPYSRLFYHFVWATHERLPLITPTNGEHIYRAIHSKAQELRGIVHALNGMPDHIHLVATVPPAVALSAFIGQIKGSASHLAARLPGAEPFAWQAEYGVLTISERLLPIVVRYVVAQQRHHADNTLDQQLELW
jgi:putative transposase